MSARRLAQLSLAAAAAVVAGERPHSQGHLMHQNDHHEAYKAHLKEHGIARDTDHVGYDRRQAIFLQRLQEIEEHNANPAHSWKKGPNHMMDWTEDEFRRLLGHRPLHSDARAAELTGGGGRGGGGMASSFLETRSSASSKGMSSLASNVNWAEKYPHVFEEVPNQLACGSCWSVAAVSAVETTHAIQNGGVQLPHHLSQAYPVSCAPNPNQCGGSGGCNGATAEIAMELMTKKGIPYEKDFRGYFSTPDGSVPPCDATVPMSYKISGFTRLPSNQAEPLMAALNQGTAVVSVDAGSWSMYKSGVLSCGQGEEQKIANHAVLALGYGTDEESGQDYWLLRNSWSPSWGENGFVRVLRDPDNCGMDNKPEDGTGCKKFKPKPVLGCNACALLMDSTVPILSPQAVHHHRSIPMAA